MELVRTDLRNVHKLSDIFVTGCKWSEQERICWNWSELVGTGLKLFRTASNGLKLAGTGFNVLKPWFYLVFGSRRNLMEIT